jgi:hypothetical protein
MCVLLNVYGMQLLCFIYFYFIIIYYVKYKQVRNTTAD